MGTVNNLFAINDLLDAILIGCFFFGLIFSVVSLLLGAAGADIGGSHGVGGPHHGGGHHGSHVDDVATPLSLGTILAFVTWFGGVAYLLRNGVGLPALLSVPLGLAAGVAGGYLIVRMLRLLREAGSVNADSYPRVVGSLGKVTSGIRPGGTGEVVYETNGVRQVTAAQSATGDAIPRGVEVVIMRRVNGVAFVERWDSFFQEPAAVDAAGHIHSPPQDAIGPGGQGGVLIDPRLMSETEPEAVLNEERRRS